MEKNASQYTKFAITTELDVASQIGRKILERGGNALDAAISSALTIGVVNLFSSGIGGGGFILIRKKGNSFTQDTFDYFDFRETAPLAVTPEMFLKNNDAAKTTGLAVCVPGEILGYYKVHEKHGKLPWKDLFKDVIELAKGFKVSKILKEKLEKNLDYINKDPGLSEIFIKDGKLVEIGDTVSRMNLVETLQKIAEDPLDMYTGDIAKRTVEFIKDNGGVMTLKDLSDYEVKTRDVLKGKFYLYDVYTTNLPTSGLFIIQALNILEKLNIKDYFKQKDDNNFYFYHMLIETLKFIFADRGKFGDPEFLDDWEDMVSNVVSTIESSKATKKLDYAKTLSINDYKCASFFKDDNGTTHLNVIDEDEMVVSLTSTINLEFGAKLMDPVTGILFNNHIDDFYIPGVDNYFDLAEMEANRLEGGKRPFSSASPTILIKDDEIIAIGAAGGTRIPSSVITIISYFFAGNSLNDSIKASRVHNQLIPNITAIEANFPQDVKDWLEKHGHEVVVSDLNTTFTSVQAIRLSHDGDKKEIEAISDLRKNGRPDGV
ncbi:hypothetical protein GINT2_000387 [Glugoides intestinalis]